LIQSFALAINILYISTINEYKHKRVIAGIGHLLVARAIDARFFDVNAFNTP